MPTTVVSSGGTFESAGDLMVGVAYIAVDSTKLSSTPSWNSLTQLPLFRADRDRVSLTVAPVELNKTQLKWYETTSTGSESDAFQSPGTAFVAVYLNSGFTTSVVHVFIEGEIIFRDRIDSSVAFYVPRHIFQTPVVYQPEQALLLDESEDKKSSLSARSWGDIGAEQETQDWVKRLSALSADSLLAVVAATRLVHAQSFAPPPK
jgi:hypothetical protein